MSGSLMLKYDAEKVTDNAFRKHEIEISTLTPAFCF